MNVNSVQHAYVSSTMQFKRFFFSTLIGTLVSAVVGITLAYQGYGVWALVAQYLINSAIDTIFLWFTVRWRPQWVYSWKRMRGLLSYGWKLLVSSLINTGYNELRSLIIGKLYSPADLAYYTKARTFPNLFVNNINASIDSVLFPAIAQNQGDPEKVKTMTRRSIKTSAYVMMPLMLGLAIVAKPLVLLLLTEKWIECVPYLKIACYTGALMPIQTANLQAIKAMGRSDIALKLEIIKKSFGLVILLVVMRYGVLAIALSALVTSTAFSFINAFPNAKLLNYKYFEQIKDVLPFAGMSLVMGGAVYAVHFIGLNPAPTIIIQVILGAMIYIMMSKIFKIEGYRYIIETGKQMLNKKVPDSAAEQGRII